MRSVTLLVLVIVGACGNAPTPPPNPTLPPRPDVPELWRTITSDEGDLRLVVPPELGVTSTAGAIVGNVEVNAGMIPFAVYSVAPTALSPREPGQSVLAWLEAGGWLPGPEQGADRGPVAQVELALPAGIALEFAAEYGAGTASQSWAMVYVIATARGHAILHFSGVGSDADEFAEQVRLIRELVEFGAP